MDTKYADLHVHTHFSDGTFSPREVVEYAHNIGLSAIAITDHDVLDGIGPAMTIARDYRIELIPGVELTAEWEDSEIHILGYYIDWKQDWFLEKLKFICRVRVERAHEIVEKLRNLGINMDIDKVFKTSGPGSVGRLHLAQELYNQGFVSSINQAFEKYIGNKGPCYVKKFRLTPKQAIDMIVRLGGVPVLAHPHIMAADEIIPRLIADGIKGIEVYHSEITDKSREHYKQLAERHGLLITGGSDCHGTGKGKVLMGRVKVPYCLVEKLKQCQSRKN